MVYMYKNSCSFLSKQFPNVDCLSGFDDMDTGCYRVSSTWYNWQESLNYCRSNQGSNLAYITSEEQQNTHEYYLDSKFMESTHKIFQFFREQNIARLRIKWNSVMTSEFTKILLVYVPLWPRGYSIYLKI